MTHVTVATGLDHQPQKLCDVHIGVKRCTFTFANQAPQRLSNDVFHVAAMLK